MIGAPQTSPPPQPAPAIPPTPAQAQPQQPSAPQASPLPPNSPVTIDAVMRLIRDEPLRRFRVDIEADSTIAGDESQEKQDRAQFIESLTKLVETWGPIVMAQPVMAPLAGELMLFGVRAFRVGRSLEQVIEETVDKLTAAAGQPKPPPQPSPDELIKLQGIKAKVQGEIMKARIALQQAQMDAQAHAAEHQADMAQMQVQAQLDQQKAATQAAQTHLDAKADAASTLMKAEVEAARFDRAVKAQNAPDKGDK